MNINNYHLKIINNNIEEEFKNNFYLYLIIYLLDLKMI